MTSGHLCIVTISSRITNVLLEETLFIMITALLLFYCDANSKFVSIANSKLAHIFPFQSQEKVTLFVPKNKFVIKTNSEDPS